MTTNRSKSIILGIMVTIVLMLISASCSRDSAGSGTLEGQVTIGPLQPVERPGFNPPVPPEVFASRKIMVYDERGKSLIKQVSIEQTDQTNAGVYRVEFPAGKYMVDINHSGIDHSSDVPSVVEIEPGQTVVLNINIDTGIR
jgi:hypothetical protein